MLVRELFQVLFCFIFSQLFGSPNFYCEAPPEIAVESKEEGCMTYPTPPPLPGKKGVCFTLRDEGKKGSWIENLPKVVALNPHWNYNWSTRRIPQQPADIEFVPMFWGKWARQEGISRVREQIELGQAQRVLGFNEPDHIPQANMSVQLALDLWSDLEDFGVSVVSPSCAKPGGEWMQAFMGNATKDCLRVDSIGVHWYGNPSILAFQRRLLSYYEMFNRPLLITEFAPADWRAATREDNRHSEKEVLTFMMQALPWLEEQDWVEGYSWFSFRADHPNGGSSALFDLEGNLTSCGKFYASVRNDMPSGDQSIEA